MKIFSELAAALLLAASLFSVNVSASTGVLERLTEFTTELKSFTADFDQTLYGEDSQVLQSSAGTVSLKRPGKFVWTYTQPESQQIIADGNKIWMFDKELDQVTVNSLQDRVGGTPLVLLMGGSDLDKQFTITALGDSDGIDWVELIPLDDSTDFEALFIGLNESGLAAMELRDNFGQATQIQFTNFIADVPLDDALFDFIPPAGVDVIGDAGN